MTTDRFIEKSTQWKETRDTDEKECWIDCTQMVFVWLDDLLSFECFILVSPRIHILHPYTREPFWGLWLFIDYLCEQDHWGQGKSLLLSYTALRCLWKNISTATMSAFSSCCTCFLNPWMEFAYFINSSLCLAVQWLHSFHSFVQCFSLCDVAFKKPHVITSLIWTWRIRKLWMKSEIHINLSMLFWFVPCFLWIQKSVSFTSFTIQLHRLHFFCNYYWLPLFKNFI